MEQRRIASLPKFVHVTANNIRENYDFYKHFMDVYGPKLVGEEHYKMECDRKTPEEWMTRSEESFGLLTMEDCREQAYQRVRNNKKVPAKYRLSGNARRNQYYSVHGIQRFNSLMKQTKQRRDADKTFGERYMHEKQQEKKQSGFGLTGKRKRSIEEREMHLVPAVCDEMPFI